MPTIPGYREQVGLKATEVSARQSAGQASAFGAALGDIGRTVSNIGLQLKSAEDARRKAQQASAVSQANVMALQRLSELEFEAEKDVDFATTRPRFDQAALKVRDEISSQLGDQTTQALFQQDFNRLHIEKSISVGKSAWKKEISAGVASLDDNLNIYAQNASSINDPQQRETVVNMARLEIQNKFRAGYIDAETAQKKEAGLRSRLDEFDAGRLIAQDPKGALSALGGGGHMKGFTLDDISAAVAQQESGGRQVDAQGNILTSSAGAQGIMQLMPETGAELAAAIGEKYDPKNAEQNKRLGSLYLKQQVEKYGDVRLALAAYNAGPGRVDAAIKAAGPDATFGQVLAKLPEETQKYVPSVLSRMSGGEVAGPAFANLDPLKRSQLMDRAERRAEAEERERVRRIEKNEREAEKHLKAESAEVEKDGYELESNGKLTREWLNENRDRLDTNAYKYFSAALEPGRENIRDNVDTLSTLTTSMYSGQDITTDLVRAHKDGKIKNETFRSMMEKNSSMRNQDGPKSEFDRTRSYITKALQPGPFDKDFTNSSARMADALDMYDRFVSEKKRTDDEIESYGKTIVQRFKSTLVSENRLSLPRPYNAGTITNQAIKLEDLDKADADILAAIDAGTMTEKEAAREAKVLSDWRQVIENEAQQTAMAAEKKGKK